MSRPWMPLYIGDYLRDTNALSTVEHGAYLLLIMEYWTKAGLPDDDAKLARIARLTLQEWQVIRSSIASFFHDGWRHGRLDKELADAAEAYDRRAKAGAKGGKSRNAQSKPEQSESNASAMQDALFKQSQPQPPSSNEEPSSLRSDAPDPEAELFRRGREVLGQKAGGLIAKLLLAEGRSIPRARASIELASAAHDPLEFIGGVIRNRGRPPPGAAAPKKSNPYYRDARQSQEALRGATPGNPDYTHPAAYEPTAADRSGAIEAGDYAR